MRTQIVILTLSLELMSLCGVHLLAIAYYYHLTLSLAFNIQNGLWQQFVSNTAFIYSFNDN